MAQDYSEHFTPIRNKLESLRSTIDQDIGRIDNALDLTLRQVFDLVDGLDSAANAYKSAMAPLYRVSRRSASTGGTSYYQRRREQSQNITRLADEAIQRQGYVITAAVTAETGYRESTVMKALDQLASERGWERRQDRETKSPRYSPKQPSEAPSSSSTA